MFSAAERSVAGKRIRVFDADTVHAFARAFELPIGFFFLPPDGVTSVGIEGADFPPADPPEQIALASIVLVELRRRIDALTRELPAGERNKLIRATAASFGADPGGLSESALIAGAVARIRAELETLDGLAGTPEDAS